MMRVNEWQTHLRNKRETGGTALTRQAPSADQDTLLKDLSQSIHVGTRKMVNYA